MSLRTPGWKHVVVAAIALLGTGAALAEGYGREDGDESEEIEKRQRWFEETRGLRQAPDARRLRAQAADELRMQMLQTAGRHLASGETWVELGPSSMDMTGWIMGRVAGRINAIAPHPTDDTTVYVGSAAGGVWKTTNAGASWTPMFDQVGTLPIGAIAIEAATPENVWVGTGDKNGGGCAGYFGQGVYFSDNGGATWVAKNGAGASAMPLSIVNAVALSPTDPNVVLAGGAGACGATGTLSGPGVYRSTDRGATWAQVLSSNVEDIVFVPGTSTVFAGLIGQGVYKSTDGGATWNPSSSGITVTSPRLRLAMSASNPSVMYVLAGTRVFRSGDGGATWVQRTTSACEGQCTYNQTIAVHPTQPDTVLVGTIRPARSTDGGLTFTPLTTTWGTLQKVHQDTHVVLYSRNDPNRFWVGSDGGIWRTDNAGAAWSNMNANLNITQFYDIAVHPTDANIAFGGAQDNGSSGRRTSTQWGLTLASGDGFMNAFDETSPNIVFQTSYPQSSLPNIYRSTESGSNGSYANVPTTGLVASSSFPFLTPLAAAGNRLFVTSNILYRIPTTGSAWTAISPNLGSAASVISPEARGAVMPTYVGTSGGRIWASVDASAPSPVFTDVTGDYPGGRVADLAMDPLDSQRVYLARAAFGASRLYRSTTGGTTWVAIGAGLPNVPANTVAVDPLDANRVFVGTDIGVYESIDGGDNFTAFSTGLPLGIVVSDLEIDSVPHVLTAGTYSRGAWRTVLAGSTANSAPTADFTCAVAGLVATCTDTSLDIDGTIASRTWSFGDGTPDVTIANPTHTYATYGRYTVTLTVADDDAATGTYNRAVRIPAPPIPLTNGVAVNNQSAAQGDELTYTLVVPPGSTSVVFTTSGPAGEDADLTVLFDGEPICDSAGATANETCTIPNPAAGTWTAVVLAYSALSNQSIVGTYTRADAVFASGFEN
ncbi:MAG TPA: PKD domain-containing protein [Xanthomonadales bacterium]|nr:PKD domain-containing protein [Xanthomonadales bacterium]